ncbi:MAG: hypothetical protein M1825_006151 [Sarcosagium campestre]|nr:MAG: hypothetical protein M1825_006151 [Sarcosagium campestre]
MIYAFILPTTSHLPIAQHYSSTSHPSLPFAASTRRSVVRDVLKRHKRLPPSSQPAHLPVVLSVLTDYLPYILALSPSILSSPTSTSGPISITTLTSAPPLILEWRPTLTGPPPALSHPLRLKFRDASTALAYELRFILSTIACVHSLLALSSLSSTTASAASSSPFPDASAYQRATKHLLTAASLHTYLASLPPPSSPPPPAAASSPSKAPSESQTTLPTDISPTLHTALRHLSHACATLLTVAKDDPYPIPLTTLQTATSHLIPTPAPIPSAIRAHLLARLCLASSTHASNAHALLSSLQRPQSAPPPASLPLYARSLATAARARACRFLAIDCERTGEVGKALGWLGGARFYLNDHGSCSGGRPSIAGLGRTKDKLMGRIKSGGGADVTAGTADPNDRSHSPAAVEAMVVESLREKWTRANDAIFVQTIPPPESLLGSLPEGREVCSVPKWEVPCLSAETLRELQLGGDHDGVRDLDGGGGGGGGGGTGGYQDVLRGNQGDDSSEDDGDTGDAGNEAGASYF